jgi:hypothetical protein
VQTGCHAFTSFEVPAGSMADSYRALWTKDTTLDAVLSGKAA